MNKQSDCLSLRVTDQQRKILEKEAKAHGMKMSEYLRESLFSTIDADGFEVFKESQMQANEQIGKLLDYLIREAKFCATITALLYKENHPDGNDKLKRIHERIFDQGDDTDE